jgi:peptidyl-prolyl cis-trans isomerase D
VTGAAGQLEDLGEDGYFVVRVDEIAPATVRPLAEVESEVRAQYMLVKRSEALDALAETARSRLAEGASASEAAMSASPAARGEISEVRRDQPTSTLDRNVLARAFTLRVGDVTVGATADGGRLALRVDAIAPASERPAEELELQRGRLAQELSADLSELYVIDLQRSFPIRVDQQLLSQATGVDSPS